MKKKYQIFISSTYTDLIEERTAVRDAILKLHQIPVGMEHFNAGDSKQWEVIKEAIDSSDYYVLIVGKKYESVITSGTDAGISYTEKEFNYALSQRVPILSFIKSDKANFRGSDFEPDSDKQNKLATFVERIKADKYVEWFENSYQLAAEVAEALHNEMAKGNRPGWVRGTQSEVEDKIDELIRLLRHELDDAADTAEDDDDWDEPVREYDFTGFRVPTDGKHREVGWNGDPIGEGEYKDGNLVRGVEYDVLVHVTSGSLIYKPDCPDDPYDASDGFTYERMESYGQRMLPRAFGASEAYIVEDGIDQYYVADIEVDEVNEHMTNIRTLEEFLKQKDPEQLQLLRDSIEDDEY